MAFLSIIILYMHAVKPPNNRHFGDNINSAVVSL